MRIISPGNEDKAERTQGPSPRWIARARESGQLPQSRELVIACSLLAFVVALRFLGPAMMGAWSELMRAGLGKASVDQNPLQSASAGWGQLARAAALALGALLAPAVVGILVTVGQGGLRLRPESLVPDPLRLDPVAGLARMLSQRAWVMSLVGLAKWLGLISLTAFWLWTDLRRACSMNPDGEVAAAGRVAVGLGSAGTKLALIMLALGLLDYARAWWEWLGQMRMSSEEVRAELREAEGDPVIRSRRRQRQAERAHQSAFPLLHAGDFLFVGKGRLTAAARLDDRSSGTIVARAAGPASDRLRQAARARGSRIVRDDALARALYEAGRVDRRIPVAIQDAIWVRTRRLPPSVPRAA